MTSELLIGSSLKGELGALLESIFIFEGRIDFLKDKHKDGIDSSHDSLAKHREPHDIIDHFASNADPSKKKIYTHKIVDWYKKKDFRQEDHGRVRQTLRDFETHKKKLPHSDIGKYKSFHHLNAALADFRPKQTNMEWGEFSQDDLNHLNGKGSTVIHDEPKYTVREVHDQRAMDILGKGTDWCVVSNKHRGRPEEGVGENSSLFDAHKKRHPGSKFFHVHDKETGERFLNHHESEQHFFDINDRERGKEFEITSKYQRGMAKTLGSVGNKAKAFSPFASQEDLHALHTDDDWRVRNSVASNPNTRHDILHTLHTDGNWRVRAGVANNPNARHDILHAMHTDVLAVKRRVASNRNTHADTLHAMHTDRDWYVRAAVANNPNTRHDILHAMHTDVLNVRSRVAANRNTRHHTLHAMHTDMWRVRMRVAANRNTRHHTLHAMHTDEDKWVRGYVAGNPSTHPDILHTLHTDGNEYVKNTAKEALEKRGLL